jgi:hypothetical protein
MTFTSRVVAGCLLGGLLQLLQLPTLFYVPAVAPWFGLTQCLYIVPVALYLQLRARPGYAQGVVTAGIMTALASVWLRVAIMGGPAAALQALVH